MFPKTICSIISSIQHVDTVASMDLSLTSLNVGLKKKKKKKRNHPSRDVSEFYLFRHLTGKRADLARIGGSWVVSLHHVYLVSLIPPNVWNITVVCHVYYFRNLCAESLFENLCCTCIHQKSHQIHCFLASNVE